MVFVVMSMCLFFSLIYVFINNEYFLSILLLFELMTLAVFMAFCYLTGAIFNCVGLNFCFVFIGFAVCEIVLGLSILVSSSRFTGAKKVKSFALMDL